LKKPVSKAQVRNQLNRQIGDYLEHGGAVDVIPTGLSGRENPEKSSGQIFDKPRETRTPMHEVVNAIEARRNLVKKKPMKPKPMLPKKKIIYDDFGEPIREIWVEH